ncbi:MAG: FAD-dependent oxidoreductase [Oscillospiraceae bacterium]|nr:FAD-dependent oxidoreductase [Oscillospiraceae bacterium]
MEESLWRKENTPAEFPRLAGSVKTDILIIGGGLTGILCAWFLDQLGADYLLIEAKTIGSGTTGNTTGKITSQHGLIYGRLLKQFGQERARLYWQANEAAIRQYRALAEKIPCDFQEKPNYVYACSDLRALETEWDALQKLNIPGSFRRETELPFSVAGAIRFSGQGQFHPGKLLAGLAPGLKIYAHTRALGWEDGEVVTDGSRIRARRIITATHFPIWNKHGAYFLKLYQQRSYLLALESGMPLEGMYLSQEKNGLTLRTAGDYLLLGGGSHRTGKKGGGWTVPEQAAVQYFPQGKIRYRWAAQDCMSLDGIPYIGPYSRRTPQLYVATGFNKWGMTSAMISAMLLTDLLQGKDNPYAAVFAPDRGILRPQLAVNAAESTRNLLSLRTPRCPHLGCALKWNPAEHSWDCPCHGSRFDEKGKLLDNPANGDLPTGSDTRPPA